MEANPHISSTAENRIPGFPYLAQPRKRFFQQRAILKVKISLRFPATRIFFGFSFSRETRLPGTDPSQRRLATNWELNPLRYTAVAV
jgi:hypothetical protein